MILFLLFISFCLGLTLKNSFVVFGVISIIFFFFVFKRFNKVILLFTLGVYAFSVGFSFINFSFQKKSYSGLVYETKENYFLINSSLEKLYVYSKGHSYEVGDFLTIEGEKQDLKFNTLESSFDFKQYLNNRGVYFSLSARNIKCELKNPIRIRAFQNYFLSYFDKDASSFVGSILFGRNEDGTLNSFLEKLHLSRLANAGGFFVYAFLSFFAFLFSLILKRRRAELASTILLSFYAIFTFPRFSVIKIFSLAIFRWFNNYKFKKKIPYISYVSIFGIIFLILNKNLINQDSFILSFSIPILLYFINPFLKRYKKIKRNFYRILIIYFFFIPFQIKYFNSINFASVIIEPILTPFILFIGILAIICFYGVPLAFMVNVINKIYSNIFNGIKLNLIAINIPQMNPIGCLIYYLIFFIILFYFIKRLKLFYPILLTISCLLTIVYCLPLNNLITDSVTFINVGQGDSCLIRHKTTTILIDTGGSLYSDIANDCLIPYFKKNRIYNLDYVITTHDDFDHKGALENLVNNFYVKNIINDYSLFPLNIDGIKFKNYNHHISEAKEENEQSLVIGFTLMKKDFLIMGDAPISIEKKIMDEYTYIPCDVLKVGHHGSDTSSCEQFINFLSPDDGIISVGKNNYGHPKDSVLKILKKCKVNIKRTDLLGSIQYSNYIFM